MGGVLPDLLGSVYYTCGESLDGKKVVDDRYVCVFIFTLFLPPKPENLARNRYSARQNPLEHKKAPTKFCWKTLTGL